MVATTGRITSFIEDTVELDDYYTAFYQVEVPQGTSATRAWRGRLQPYRNDNDAWNLLDTLERGSSISCDQGFLSSRAGGHERTAAHWAKPFLVSMTQHFQVLILERQEPMHPVVFSLRPEISGYRFPGHPHLRTDISLQYAGRTLHGLCIYSAPDFIYARNVPRIVHFVDQVSTYLARHLVWEKTRRLEDFSGKLLYQPEPGKPIFDTEPRVRPSAALPFLKHPKLFPQKVWRGHWPGKGAPAGPKEHLATIKPNQECWCGSGRKYGLCHREFEVSLLAR